MRGLMLGALALAALLLVAGCATTGPRPLHHPDAFRDVGEQTRRVTT